MAGGRISAFSMRGYASSEKIVSETPTCGPTGPLCSIGAARGPRTADGARVLRPRGFGDADMDAIAMVALLNTFGPRNSPLP